MCLPFFTVLVKIWSSKKLSAQFFSENFLKNKLFKKLSNIMYYNIIFVINFFLFLFIIILFSDFLDRTVFCSTPRGPNVSRNVSPIFFYVRIQKKVLFTVSARTSKHQCSQQCMRRPRRCLRSPWACISGSVNAAS